MTVTPTAVAGWLGDAALATIPQLADVCDAVEVHYAEHYQPDPVDPDTLLPVRSKATDLALVMMAARLYRRRHTPEGVTTGDLGPAYVPRFDPDIDRLLHRQSGVA